ncbi:cytochrome P450 [Pisolithus marmoratus]|nr:cytochrome P450 [Pisolithus marmoratus]
MDIWLPAFALMLLSVACGIATYWTSRRKHHPFPPGPKPLPIVGNILGIDPGAPWVSYTEWGKTYGELVYTRILNQEIIIINSEEVAKDLLDRRSGNYSDRPKVIRMTNDFFGWSFNTAMISYSNRWRLHRRLFHQAFRAEASLSYRPIQMRKARELLLNLLEAPADFPAHFKTYSASVIMSIVYGYELAPRDDPIITIVERAVDLAIESIRPEVAAFLGLFPFLRYVPSWFPGASFKRTALRSQKYAGDMVDAPFQFVEKNMESVTVIPSMVTESLKRVSGDDDERYSQAVRESSGTAFAAGSETTASTLLVFVLAMLLYPEVQQRAQAELDSVLGTDRLPGFEDRASMPYVEAVYRETLRWNPTVPLGIPHATTNADVYNGYFIPQGATIITNTWAMTRNEARYSNPEEFRPQRFFTANGELNDDHVNYAFGAGRRICVGRYIADASLWSAMVSILAKFNISKCKDGKFGFSSHPYDFGCNFVPRLPGLTVEKLRQMF